MTTDRQRGVVPAVLATALIAVFAARAAPPMVRAATDPAPGVPWTLPVRDAAQADLAAAPDGTLLLSWVEGEGEARRLRFARERVGRWDAPRTVASGDWFGSPVDTPHLRQTPDGALWATWMRKGAGGGHARDLVLARSADGGRTWSRPAPVHRDGSATEHGFVSTWAVGRDRLGVAWLDGRAKAGQAHGEGAQMLRSATFDAGLRPHAEEAVDAKVCDCCHTDVAATSRGPLLVYRDRSDAEVRDIRAVHLGAAKDAPREVHRDGWTMPGCPVNGPSVAAHGARVATAWYTAADGAPEVRVALSSDAGGRFAAPVTLDRGEAVLGRTDVAMVGSRAAVGWLREEASSQSLWLATVDATTKAPRPMRLASLAGRGRGTGMPRLAVRGSTLHVVWTDIVGGRPVLRGRMLPMR